MLNIFNCGQGDALNITTKGCHWDKVPLYIDLGPAKYKKKIKEEFFDLLITHCHDDHLSGTEFKASSIRNLYLPAYFPEVRKILKKLMHRAPTIPWPPSGKTILVYDGYRIGEGECNHNIVFNPPLDPLEPFKIDEINDELVDGFLEKSGLDLNSIIQQPDILDNVTRPDGYQEENFIKAAIQKIATSKSATLDKAVKKFMEFDSNALSVVFKYSDISSENNDTYLLTGDADVAVFRRLIKNMGQA